MTIDIRRVVRASSQRKPRQGAHGQIKDFDRGAHLQRYLDGLQIEEKEF